MARLSEPSEILPRFLYLGNALSGTTPAVLQEHGITHIVNVSEQDYRAKLGSLQVSYLFCHTKDHPHETLSRHFDVIHSFIEKAAEQPNARVLVHCEQGASRSPSAVIAYLILKHRWSLVKAYAWVYARRPTIEPNNGFLRQLCELEHNTLGTTSVPKDAFAEDWGFGSFTILKTADQQMKQEEEKDIDEANPTL